MAATNPNTGPARQEQPPAATQGNHNLDTLQSMLNLIFMQSGRFIKEHQSGGGTGRQKVAMQRAVPAATERFHDALDELENEVRLAQTVLRRDLALLKQERKKKEAAAKQQEAEKARLAAESRSAPIKKEESPAAITKVSTPIPDVPLPATEPAKVETPEMVLKRDEEPILPPPINTAAEPERDPLFDGTPTTANPHESEFDFEAMFGDTMDTSGDHNADDMMDTSNDMLFSLDEPSDAPSLLRGLEDFAKSSDADSAPQTTNMDIDFAMPDLPDLGTTATEPQPPATKPAEPPAPQPAAEPPKEPEVDNDMMATMGGDDLEDLFNLDEYANPEESSFDDAFFNFE